MNVELSEYEELWDDKINLESELADKNMALRDAFDGMETITNLVDNLLNHPESHTEHRIWRKGLYQAMHRVQRNVAGALEVEED